MQALGNALSDTQREQAVDRFSVLAEIKGDEQKKQLKSDDREENYLNEGL